MPRNRYICYNCEKEWTFIGPYKERACATCGEVSKPELPTSIAEPSVFETVDKDWNTKQRQNFEERAAKRNSFYMKKTAKERAREHGDSLEKHGITEDDAKMV